MTWTVTAQNGNERTVESRSQAEDVKQEMEQLGMTVEIETPISDGGTDEDTEEPIDVPSVDEPQNEPAQNTSDGYDLPDSVPVDTDPLVWMPDEFTDTIDNTVAINRKGFEVICQHFGVQVSTDKVHGPYETDHEYAEVKAKAITSDGETYTAYATARSEGGDDVNNLLELADTRAYKRAASRATGVGMLAVEEIQGSL